MQTEKQTIYLILRSPLKI